MKLRFHEAATDELIAAVDFYEERSEGLGRDFFSELHSATGKLLENPELGMRLGSDIRRLVLRRFPYNLIYAIEADELLVLAVAHHRRRPLYWTDRL